MFSIRLLDIIDEMIFAEAIQLENRGRIDARMRDVHCRLSKVRRRRCSAGRCLPVRVLGALQADACKALEEYGLHLGVAFQLIDDYLDYAGDGSTIGKSPFTDLREGKMTHPVIVALERDPSLAPRC